MASSIVTTVRTVRTYTEINFTRHDFQSLIVSFPKDVKRKDLQKLSVSLIFGKFEDGEESEAFVNALLAILFNATIPYLDRLLAYNCLLQLTPQHDLCQSLSSNIKCLACCHPVVFAQGMQDVGFSNLVELVLKSILSCELKEYYYHLKVLSFACRLIQSKPALISSEFTRNITNHILDLLDPPIVKLQASETPQKSQTAVKELDGSISFDRFTALSLVDSPVSTHLLSNHAFSVMQTWILGACHMESLSQSSSGPNSRIEKLLTPLLVHRLKNYCSSIVEQSQRVLRNASNEELQQACCLEALQNLNLTCLANQEPTLSTLAIVRRHYELYISKEMNPQVAAVVIAAAQFLILHSNTMIYKMNDIGPFLFGNLSSNFYHDNWISFELIKFLRDNLSRICYNSSLLELYFPSLLKILAWSPTTFLDDFIVILPTFLSNGTAIELFNTILDLPCLSAALMIQNNDAGTKGSLKMGTTQHLAEGLQNPDFQAMLSFVLRSTSGLGDTFNRIHLFHADLNSFSTLLRVVLSAQASLELLRCYFDVCIQHLDESTASLLIPVILERLNVIFTVDGFQEQVQVICSNAILGLFSCHQNLIIHRKEDLVNFCSNIQNSISNQTFITHLAWCIGEHLCFSRTKLCELETVSFYYESLECLMYQILGQWQLIKDESSIRMLCVFLSSLAALVTRCQDLIPRALLCLSKVGQKLISSSSIISQTECYKSCHKIAMDRVRELLAVLKTPNVATLILSPSEDIYHRSWHNDSSCLPFLLKTATSFADKKLQLKTQ